MNTLIHESHSSPLQRLIIEVRESEPLWFYAVVGHLALLLVCLLASSFDPRLLNGVSVWSKPAKFALSLAVYFATLLLFVRYLPRGYLSTRPGRLMVHIPFWCAFLEMVYITLQAALGEASHFNTSTPFHATMYSLMGMGATLLVAVLGWMGWVIGRHNGLHDAQVLAVVLGLVLTFVLGGGFGGYLGGMSQHWVGAAATDANGIPLFNWARDGGDLRVAHFFGMHAMQAIPLLALALPGSLAPGLRVAAVIAISTAYAAFSWHTFTQALQGLPFIS